MPIPGDPYWESVTALLHADATVGTNITTDVSPSPKTVSTTGSAVISSTQSMFGGASIYSPGSGSYFTVANGAGGAVGTNNFTMEGWCYVSSGAGTSILYSLNNPASSFGGVHMTPSGLYASTSGSAWDISPSGGINLIDSTWHHTAIVRNGTSLTLWIDGVLRSTYTIAAGATFDFTGTLGTIFVGNTNTAAVEYVDEFRFTRGIARYTAPFTPTGPFPDANTAFTRTSLYRLEAIGRGFYTPPGDVKVRSTSKQVLMTTTTRVSRLSVEIIGRDSSFVIPGDLRLRSASKQVMFTTTPIVQGLTVEVIGADNSFVRPGDTRARSVSKQVLLAEPKTVQASQFSVETIGYRTTPTPSSDYTVEVISGLPYSVVSSNFILEVIAESSITPPRPQTTAVWFTVIDP